MRILVIGDLSGQFLTATQIAIKRGAKINQSSTIASALDLLRSGKGADLILIEVKADIKSLVETLNEERIYLPVVACGFHVTKQEVTKAIEDGAVDYLPLPPNEELIVAVLNSIINDQNEFIAQSEAMKKIVDMAQKVATSEATILITGESGTGKEVIAKFIHQHSKRKGRVFIGINCAAIPDNLLESELFGHEKGAFTGALARRVGKFEEASGGTLLLDEISEMDIRLQAKLLRVIQEREITRIGGTGSVKVDTRIIATSNRNLKQEVSKGNFREDLYYRLNVINLALPALRERTEDIINIAQFYAEKYAKQNGLNHPEISSEAKQALINYSWPGNVRELENTMFRAVLFAGNQAIKENDLMLSEVEKTAINIEEAEKNTIKMALNTTIGDRLQAAKILGISIKILEDKIEQYELKLKVDS
ncbi:sigma-54-dependent transcriptional regulator [Rickettsiales endosymbiont of Stachyamoeba lipophora]|uniref:sigma-54-dependent transcriptional regulator n=1 Tax=Rickettsiales endosymbiont of Stachyamoeba lipophora TaxID=2486578 RepID=UPI000F653520|nr:sigma-54 dependent transcriptional regulator [Rickettsiales endosymbiont of Stachyamoeba lipophora]AZL15280.1 sigma-54-dependent Fis family transcriptional regulator [Rickettsiales endosymbiont of Stachyamoeba lipophora]